MTRPTRATRQTLSLLFIFSLCIAFAPGEAHSAVRKVASAGDIIPGVGGTFSNLFPPHVLQINDNTEVLFWSGIENGPADAGLFLFTGGTIRKVVMHGENAPTGGTYRLISLNSAKLNAKGEVAFVAQLTGGRSPVGVFIWRRPTPASNGTITTVVAAGDPAPQPALIEPKRDADIFLLDLEMGMDLNDNGTISLFAVQGKRTPFTTVSRANLYLANGGSLSRIFDGGTETSAGKLNLIATLAPFGNNNNQILMWTLADVNKQSVVVCTVGACRKVVAVGDAIPGGAWGLATGPCCMLGFNDAAQVALSGNNLRGEVLLWTGSAITRLVGAGDAVTDPAGAILDSLSADEIHRRRQALNNLGELAFVGRLPNPVAGVTPGIFVKSQGAIRKVVLVGDTTSAATRQFSEFASLALSDTGCLAFSGSSGPAPFNHEAWISDFPAVPGQAARTCSPLTGRVFVALTRPAGPMKRNPTGFYSGELPVRRAKLTLENSGGTAVAEQFTRDNGRYSFPAVVGMHRLKLTLEDKEALIRVFDANRDAANVAFARTQLFAPPANGQQDWRLLIGAGGGANTTSYDPPLDSTNPSNSTAERFAHLAYAYHNEKFSAQVASNLPIQRAERVNVQSTQGTSHSCIDHRLEISAADSVANNPDRDRPFADFHEYGHHVVCASPIAGVEDEPRIGDAGNHSGIRSSNSSDAWLEGSASFLAAVDAEQGTDPQPHVLVWAKGNFMNLVAGGARLDDPNAAGYNPTFGALGEEFAVASIMWEMHRRLGLFHRLWSILRANTPDLETWKDVYDAFKAFEGTHATLFSDLTGTRCTFNGNLVNGLDCLFVERGFYQDADSDGLYSSGEEVGVTRWNGMPARGPAVRRGKVPLLFGSTMRLRILDARTLAPLDNAQLLVAIRYDAPLEEHNVDYPLPAEGSQPYEVPIAIPGSPSRAVIIAQRAGYEDSAPLIIESSFFHERIDPSRPGGVSEILLEHTFHLIPLQSGDTTPPTTLATISPPPTPEGWNDTPVTVEFNAMDDTGGSGMQHITVQLSGAQTGTTITPNSTISIPITEDGLNTILFSATDNAGNQEAIQTLLVRIDKTPPEFAGLPERGCVLWPPDKKLLQVARISVTDALSGVGSFNVTGSSSESPSRVGQADIVIQGSGLNSRIVKLRADRRARGPGRVYIIKAVATDVAGNFISATATCKVPRDQHKKNHDKRRHR